jgi:LCP family protein required for cell wall assembly
LSKTDTPLEHPRRHRVLKVVAMSVALVLVVVAVGGFFVYRHLDHNITRLDVNKQLGTDRPTAAAAKPNQPTKPVNVLIIGSDTRKGQGPAIGGETPGLSDTTILLHLSANRKYAYGVSLPRDAMVHRPTCLRKDGSTDRGGLSMFNAAYAIGGPGCTVRTVEQLTRVPIDHFVVVDFKGFKAMVNALGGVEVCVPTAVNDTTGHIRLPAGTYNVKGERALDYVRVRHDLGTAENGDIGRMKRQQTFLASMANKAVSAGTLANPLRLYKFLDAGTKSLTTDPGLASLKQLVSMGRSFDGIGLKNIQFLTVPFEAYPPDANRLQWAPSASRLWTLMREDRPVGTHFSADVTTAETKNGKPASPPPSPTASPSASPSRGAAAQRAAENGLCA